jgi:hypothetical protein
MEITSYISRAGNLPDLSPAYHVDREQGRMPNTTDNRTNPAMGSSVETGRFFYSEDFRKIECTSRI